MGNCCAKAILHNGPPRQFPSLPFTGLLPCFCLFLYGRPGGTRQSHPETPSPRPERHSASAAPHPAGTIFPPNSSLLRAHSSISCSTVPTCFLRVPAVYLLLFCMGKEQSTRPQELRYRQTLERKTEPEAVSAVSL